MGSGVEGGTWFRKRGPGLSRGWKTGTVGGIGGGVFRFAHRGCEGRLRKMGRSVGMWLETAWLLGIFGDEILTGILGGLEMWVEMVCSDLFEESERGLQDG